MSFLLTCPNCGPRGAEEFRFGGEAQARPRPDDASTTWTDYLYFRDNEAGPQREWWYHRGGCRAWFVATRDTRNNRVVDVSRFEVPSR